MTKTISNTIPVNTELTYTGDNGPFYTKGNKYLIRSCVTDAGSASNTVEYSLDDDKDIYNHTWDESILDSFEVTKQLYTKEMIGNSVLPKENMDCMIKGSSYDDVYYRRCKLLFMGSEVFVYLQYPTESGVSDQECYGVINQHDFKEIDTRTDEQKTIDDIIKIDQRVHADIDFGKSFLEAVKNNEIHDISFTGSK